VETQFQNSGTRLSRRAKGLVGRGRAPCHQKKATPEDPNSSRSPSLTLPPSSFDNSSSRSSTSRSLFASLSCSVYLDRHFDHPSRSRDCFRLALPALLLAWKQGLTRLILKHSNIPRILHLPLLYYHPQYVDLAGTRRDYHRGNIRSILAVTSYSPFKPICSHLHTTTWRHPARYCSTSHPSAKIATI
jgi:hypothetical protein